MVKACVARNCKRRDTKEQNEVSFHRFPLTRPKLLAKWVHALRRQKWQPNTHSYICSKHFLPEDFKVGKRKNLIPDAVPSVFDFPPNVGPRPVKKRRILCYKPADTPIGPLGASTSPVKAEVEAPNIGLPQVKKNNIGCGPTINTPTGLLGDRTSQIKTEEDESSNIDLPAVEDEEIPWEPDRPTPMPGTSAPTSGALADHCYLKTDKSPLNTTRATQTFLSSLEAITWKKKVRALHEKIRRKNRKIKSLNELLSDAKKTRSPTEEAITFLKHHFSGFQFDFLMHTLKNRNKEPAGKRYSELMRQFSLRLYLYSQKAFKLLREEFDLPHPGMMRKWIASVNYNNV